MEWISVKDGLPKKRVSIYVATASKMVHTSMQVS